MRRDEASFLITASGKDKGRLTADDFLVCDLDGAPVDAAQPQRPSAETLVHCAIYAALPEVGAVYHVHEVHAALCSDRDAAQGETRFRGLEMIKGLDIWDTDEVSVPIVPNHADIPALARAVAQQLAGRAPAVNIERHGFYAWGRTAFEAKRHTETLAYLFRYSWEASARAR